MSGKTAQDVMFVDVKCTSFLSITATYDFLAIEDTSKDKVMDVLFVLKGSQNISCFDAGTRKQVLQQKLHALPC